MNNKMNTFDENHHIDAESAIQVVNYTKHYKGAPRAAVEDLNFKVAPGEFHAFIGANGAGKTTTIKAIIGAYGTFKGDIYIYGHKQTTVEAKKRIGYIPEHATFPKGVSTLSFITQMCYLAGYPMKQAKAMAAERLQKLGLSAVVRRNPNKLSSGQKKKVLLAQALVGDPDILIMDEPAANLDPKARVVFFNQLKKLQSEGKAIFVSSHILAELDKYVDSATILDGGKVKFTGRIDELSKGEKASYTYLIDVSATSKSKVKDFLRDEGIKFFEKDKDIVAKAYDEKWIGKFYTFVGTNGIELNKVATADSSLESIYERFSEEGSVDTGVSKEEY